MSAEDQPEREPQQREGCRDSVQLSRQIALALFRHGADGIINIAREIARLLQISLQGWKRLWQKYEPVLSQLPGAAVAAVQLLIKQALTYPAVQKLIAIFCQLASLKVTVSTNDDLTDSSSKVSARITTYLSLFFGAVRMRGYNSLILSAPSLQPHLQPELSAWSPLLRPPINRGPSAMTPISLVGPQDDEMRVLCSSELKQAILDFLHQHNKAGGQEFLVLRHSTPAQSLQVSGSTNGQEQRAGPWWQWTGGSTHAPAAPSGSEASSCRQSTQQEHEQPQEGDDMQAGPSCSGGMAVAKAAAGPLGPQQVLASNKVAARAMFSGNPAPSLAAAAATTSAASGPGSPSTSRDWAQPTPSAPPLPHPATATLPWASCRTAAVRKSEGAAGAAAARSPGLYLTSSLPDGLFPGGDTRVGDQVVAADEGRSSPIGFPARHGITIKKRLASGQRGVAASLPEPLPSYAGAREHGGRE